MFSIILSKILRDTWAIDERFALSHGFIVESLMGGLVMDQPDVTTENNIPFFMAAGSGEPNYNKYDEAPAGSIAVVPVNGPLMKADVDECGVFNAGMSTLGQRIKEAAAHENISSIILHIDSPGGTVDGTQELADVVAGVDKPVIAYVDGLAASAAYWIASGADKIIVNNDTAEVGSIGVMVAFADMQPMWENDGVKFHHITSDQSPDKNKDIQDAKDGKYEGIKKNSLNPLADIFINNVKENRPNINEKALTGKTFYAQEALTMGLIDQVGGFDIAVDTAVELVQDIKTEATTNTNIKSKEMKKFERIAKAAGISADFEVTAEGVHMSAEALQAVEAAMEAAETAQAAHEAALAAATQAAQDTAVTEVAAINTSLDAIDETVAEAATTEEKIQTVAGIISALRDEVPAEESAVITSEGEKGEGTGVDKPVVKENMSFHERMAAVKKEYC